MMSTYLTVSIFPKPFEHQFTLYLCRHQNIFEIGLIVVTNLAVKIRMDHNIKVYYKVEAILQSMPPSLMNQVKNIDMKATICLDFIGKLALNEFLIKELKHAKDF